MPKGFVYILECADGTYYTGSTIDIDKRLVEHTKKIGHPIGRFVCPNDQENRRR